MDSSSWIAMYLIFIIIFVTTQNEIVNFIIGKTRKKKGGFKMTNELIKALIGKKCKISTGSYGASVNGIIIEVNENWIEVETKKGLELVNTEFVQSLKICKD